MPSPPAVTPIPAEPPARGRLSIHPVSGQRLRADAALQAELAGLAGPSYEDPSAILAREVADCTHLYLRRDADGRLAGFFMVRHELAAAAGGLPLVHLGWSVCRDDLKGRGATMALFGRGIRDVQRWERRLGRRALLWSTTASPTIYLGVARHLAEVEPRPDASYSADGARHAARLRARLGAAAPAAGEHPFAVRAIAAATRYSAAERARLERVCRQRGFGLFARLGIDETRADRLIFIARTPTALDEALGRASRLAPVRAAAAAHAEAGRWR